MSGVIDENGQQWERCNRCSDWVRFQELHFEEPSDAYDCGRDLCGDCVQEVTAIEDKPTPQCEVEGCDYLAWCEVINMPAREPHFYCWPHSPHAALMRQQIKRS